MKGAHELQIEETMETLAERPEGFYGSDPGRWMAK